MKNLKFIGNIFILILLSTMIWSCGGSSSNSNVVDDGSGNNNGQTTGTDVVLTGTMDVGSVIVDGVRFTVASGATILIDDNPGTENELEHGMEIELRGHVNDDGVTGVADFIVAESELRGLVESVNAAANPQSFVVLGQSVIVDDLTIYANAVNLAGISAGDPVEVHGQRDASNNIRASRVELLTGDIAEAEIRGTVSALSGNTFSIGVQVVDLSGASIEPTGTAIANGDFVEVKGNLDNAGVLIATVVQLEDIEHPETEPAESEHFEVEGFVSGFSALPGTFLVAGQTVTTGASTDFENGSSEDMDNNIEVEAEGHNASGVLLADKIKFKRPKIRFITDNMNYDSGAGTLTMYGKIVVLNDLTDIRGDAATSTRLEMRGYVDSAGNIIAERLEDGGNNNSGRDILQAVVEVENETASTLTFLEDIVADLSDPGVEFHNDNEAVILRAEFFGAVTVGSVVKARGEFDAGTNTLAGDEAEIEN